MEAGESDHTGSDICEEEEDDSDYYEDDLVETGPSAADSTDAKSLKQDESISKLWLAKLSDYLSGEDGSAVLTNLTGELVLETAFNTLTTAGKRRLMHLRDYFLFLSLLD